MKSNFYKYLVILFLMVFLLPMTVFAQEKLELKVDKSDLEIGDEIIVSANVPGVTDMYAFLATLKYDTNVFQKIDETDFSITDTESISYNQENNKFGIVNRSGEIASDGVLFRVRLKVKKDANVGDTNIALTNISSSDGGSKTTFPTTSIKVSVTRDAMEAEVLPNNKENVITEDEETVITAFTNIPILIVIAIVFVALGVYLVIYTRKEEKNKKVIWIFGTLEILLLLLALFLLLSNYIKKDVNQDGVKDYDDAQEIIDYLIDMEGHSNSSTDNPTSTLQPRASRPSHNYDTNNDGKVDIEDAGHTTEDVTKKTSVKLTEQNLDNEYYVNKGEITLRFTAQISPKEVKIKQVKINDKYYDVTFVDGAYIVTLDTPTNAGKYDFTISEVVLDNGKHVSTTLKITREILKEVPYVSQLNLDESSGTLTFELNDVDSAFISGKVNIYQGSNLVASKEVEKDKTTLTFETKEDVSYTVEIIGSYDLDSNPNDGNNHYDDQDMYTKSFVLGGDYHFTLTNFSITDAIQRNETPVISFVSTNNRDASIQLTNMTIDDKSNNFVITKQDGNNYEVQLVGANTTPGKHTVTLNDVELNQLKTFYNGEDYTANTLTYTVLKDAPLVDDLTVEDDAANKSVKVNFKFKDTTSATNKLTVVLIDSIGRIVTQKEISKDDLKDNIELSLSYANNVDGYYTVKVLGDYELSDSYTYAKKSLGEASILVTKNIYIEKMYVTDNSNKELSNNYLYVTKNQKNYQIAIELYVDKSINEYAREQYKRNSDYSRVSTVTINGLNYQASSVSGYTKSKIFLTVPAESGTIDIKATRVQLTLTGYYNMLYNDQFSVPEKQITIEVLKDKPTIQNLTITDDYNQGQATFDFDVVLDKNAVGNENDFNNGTIQLGNQSAQIVPGHNTVTFDNVEKDQNLDLIFKADYDLDTDVLNDLTGEMNEFKNETLFTVKYGLYDQNTYDNIAIENTQVISEKDNSYFEKNEKVKLNFAITGIDEKLGACLDKVIINNKEYTVTKNEDHYELILDGYYSSGKKKITINDILLSNGKKVTLKNAAIFQLEVLKDAVLIDDFTYEVVNDDVKVSLSLKDTDSALIQNSIVLITDESGNAVYCENYQDEITFHKNQSLRYYVKVTATYDRDLDPTEKSDNYTKDEVLLDETISLEKNNIELKNISDINLYKIENKNDEEVITLMEEVSVSDLRENFSQYFVEIEMDYMPTTRARILKVIEDEDTHMLTLSLKYEYVTKEGTKSQIIHVDFGTIDGDKVKNEAHPEAALKVLLERLQKGEDVTLNRNYDASLIKVETNTYVTGNYSGHFNGNGYTIINLSKPLFDNIENGTIENLKIDTVNITSANVRGIVANTANGATIKNVFINNVNRTNSPTESGLLIGIVKNSTIEECRIVNFKINDQYLAQQLGSLIGRLEASTVKNCYVNGTLSASWNYVSGFIGNVVGKSYLINNYSKVTYSNYATTVACSFACANTDVTMQNNIDVGSYGDRITPFTNNNLSSKSQNNYHLLGNNRTLNKDGVTSIDAEEINEELFKKADFDPSLWYLRNTSIDYLPTLIQETKTKLETVSGYESDKEILYNNLKKIMPFYDDDKIIKIGKNVTNNLLLSEEVTHIVPLAKDGNLVTYLTTESPKKISKIIIIFKNGMTIESNVTYDKIYDMVATYKVNGLNIDYHYNHYVINSDSQVVNNLTNYLQGLDYTNNLDILTTNNDSRIYRDFYNDTTKKELKEFVLKYLSNSNYTNTSNDDNINSYIEREVKRDQKIEKALYTYNYFRRFYDLEVNGMKLYDFVLFNMQGFNENLTLSRIIDLYFSDGTGANFNTNATDTNYVNLLSKYTGLDHIPDLLEFIVTHVSDYNMDEWTASQFKGILVEIPVEGHEDDIDYTLWDHLSTEDTAHSGSGYKIYNYALPILTLPDTAGYIISAPAQFTIGAQRVYMTDPTDPNELEPFKEKMKAYIGRISSYYNTIYDILGDRTLLNNMHLYQIDKRTTKDVSGASVFNMPYTTEEPFHKNFDEVVNVWPAEYGVNAGNWGDHLEWNVAGFMDSTLTTDGTIDPGHPTFMTWSHETAHYFDARLFLENYGRRFNSGGEDYCEGFLMQQFGPRDIVMNLTVKYNSDQRVASNMTPERINSKKEIKDFYSKVFETLYVMDYIEAQAFMKLTNEQKAVLGFQANYPDEEKYKDTTEFYLARLVTQYKQLTAEEWSAMKLNDIDDLIENRITMVPGLYEVGSRGDNLYGGEGIANIHWYQPWNPNGRPDSYSLKWISYEMLGYAGYDEGFIEYASNKDNITKNGVNNFKSDSMALKKITGYDSMDAYKKNRFALTKEKLEHLKYINIDEYAQKFYDALVKDATVMQEKVDSLFQGAGGEDKCLKNNYWCTRYVSEARNYPNSSQVREDLYFALKTSTNDFIGDIFSNDVHQTYDFDIQTNND